MESEMANEDDARRQVETYLRSLGLPASSIATEVVTNRGQHADFVVYRNDKKPLAVIEVKAPSKDYPHSKDSKLRFHPYVRQAQLLANDLNVAYYLLSDGLSFFWFQTDSSGWPALIDEPIGEAVSEVIQERLSKAELVRVLQTFQEFMFWRGGSTRPEEIAVVILAKLLSETGDNRLAASLKDSRQNQFSFPWLVDSGLDRLFSEIASPRAAEQKLAQAFELIEDTEFLQADPKVALSALDATLLDPRRDFGPWRISRWLADFMVRLANISDKDTMLDLSASYGDVLAATCLRFPKASLWGITSYPLAALWIRIQQLILHNNKDLVRLGEPIPRATMEKGAIPRPTRIISAPSFGTKIEHRDPKSALSNSGVRNVEDLYLELALDWVSPNGRVVMLVPEGLLFTEGKRIVTRQMLLSQACLRAVISLAPGLLSANSLLKSSVLVFEKRRPNQNTSTFFGLVEHFDEPDTFDAQQLGQVNQILEEFVRYETGAQPLLSRRARVVASTLVDSADLTFSHYFSDSIDKSTRFPIYRLEEVAIEVRRGARIPLSDSGEIPVIGPAAIRQMQLDASSSRKANRLEVPPNAPTVVEGDTLLNIIGTHLGEAALATTDVAGFKISSHVVMLRPNPAKVLPEYLPIALNSDHVKKQFVELQSGAVIRGLPLKRLRSITIPIPDLSTQNQIISAVEKARSRVKETKTQLELFESELARLVATVAEEGVQE
jgi:hypothetical protein